MRRPDVVDLVRLLVAWQSYRRRQQEGKEIRSQDTARVVRELKLARIRFGLTEANDLLIIANTIGLDAQFLVPFDRYLPRKAKST